jgi:hypothetical protein
VKNASSRPKVPVPLSDIQEHFRATLGFLHKSCVSYDAGDVDEFRRIAVEARKLVHDSGRSRSLINQLDLQGVFFISFGAPINMRNALSDHPLVSKRIGNSSAEYRAPLNDSPFPPRFQTFDAWWNEQVYRSSKGLAMTRRDFILTVANQAGGAHVDPEIDRDYYRIARENETGWWLSIGDDQLQPVEGLERAYVRQIGFEIYETLQPEWARILGNRLCDCGSGRKFRYCHGKRG